MKRALLIGINYVGLSCPQLNGCIDDIENMQELLVSHFGYDASAIVMLRDDVKAQDTLPTHQNILENLKQLSEISSDNDELWIHYSGHGSLVSIDATHTRDVILPVDYQTSGVINDDDLFSIIKTFRCKAMLLFDCCHSGSVCEMPFVYNLETKVMEKKRDVDMSNNEIYVISGCKDNQTSADAYDDGANEYVGAFSYAFIQCVLAKTEITLVQLYEAVCKYLAKRGFLQTPILSSSSSENNSETL